jgi:S1-C subfamily serine protease
MVEGYTHTGRLDWAAMQDAMQNSVVQVVAQVARYNWVEPYAIQDQFENRGSGFFIDTHGHVITNAHVVDEATMVWIHLPSLGKKAIFADVIGFCPDRDLALLRVRDADFAFLKTHIGAITPLPFGDSDLVRRTDEVLVLGYPLGHYIMKSSTGVVSGRESYGGYSLIQITAAINPGNSGGPLINTFGQVIGIAIATVDGAQNIGFGIPINELKLILDDLYTTRLVRRETLGIQLNYANEELTHYLQNPVPGGIYIGKVYKDSLAEKAGIQEGDMLYEFNNFKIDEFGDATVPWSRDKITINDLVARLKKDEEVSAVLYRKGKKIVTNFAFSATKPYPIRRMYPGYENIEYEVIAGMVLMQLADNHFRVLGKVAPDLYEYVRMERKINPQLVMTHIIPGSMAHQTRILYSGFIIAEINEMPVHTLDALRTALFKSLETKELTIKTDDGVFTVLPFEAVIKDEERLSKNFAYPLSPTIKELLKAIK